MRIFASYLRHSVEKRNGTHYGLMSRVVFLRSRNSFPEAVRVRMKYIQVCIRYLRNIYIFADRRFAWAKLVLSQSNVSCLDRSDRQKSRRSRVPLPFAGYLIFRSPPHNSVFFSFLYAETIRFQSLLPPP